MNVFLVVKMSYELTESAIKISIYFKNIISRQYSIKRHAKDTSPIICQRWLYVLPDTITFCELGGTKYKKKNILDRA